MSSSPIGRYYPRQEPSALIAPARICAGGGSTLNAKTRPYRDSSGAYRRVWQANALPLLGVRILNRVDVVLMQIQQKIVEKKLGNQRRSSL